jgi:raffinose/stachyose/melibiose transport system substrate-binding protein
LKKLLTVPLAIIILTALISCSGPVPSGPSGFSQNDEYSQSSAVTLVVSSTFAGNDGNAGTFQQALYEWTQETGNSVIDRSATADENSKDRIRLDFAAGSEPDVLFFFTGQDADTFIDKVVPVAEIRTVFPNYAGNMDESLVPRATNGEWYAVPANGYWENLFVNKYVLEKSGVELPGTDYSWTQFLLDCAAIKAAGFVPIAASFEDVPHYWWELSVFNNGSPDTHLELPSSEPNEVNAAWIEGMNDIKYLYDQGFFPENALSGRDSLTQELFYNNSAAFMLDGSWRVNTIKQKCQGDTGTADLSNFTIVNFPSKGKNRKATDMIAGFSSGWYISRKAWNNTEKMTVCVDFVEFMTSDRMVLMFSGTGSSALKKQSAIELSGLDSLDRDIVKMLSSASSLTPNVQDSIPNNARNYMFRNMPKMMDGYISPEELVSAFISSMEQQ